MRGCQRCGGTLTRDRDEDDGTLCCLICGWRKYGRAPLLFAREGDHTAASKPLNKSALMAVQFYKQGLSSKQVADHMEVGYATVKTWLKQGREQGLLEAWVPPDLGPLVRYAEMHGRQAAMDHFRVSRRQVQRAVAQGREDEDS